jgi:hypothetical protein
MATMEVRKCPQWKAALAHRISEAEPGDVLIVADREMADEANRVRGNKRLRVYVRVAETEDRPS